jgi:hypothetical protein
LLDRVDAVTGLTPSSGPPVGMISSVIASDYSTGRFIPYIPRSG